MSYTSGGFKFDLLDENERVEFLKNNVKNVGSVKLIASGNDPKVNASILSGAVKNYVSKILGVPCRLGHIQMKILPNTQSGYYEVPLYDISELGIIRLVKLLQYPVKKFQVCYKDWNLTYCPRIVFSGIDTRTVRYGTISTQLLERYGIISTEMITEYQAVVIDVVAIMHQGVYQLPSCLDYFGVLSQVLRDCRNVFFLESENCFDYMFRLSETIRLKRALDLESLSRQKEAIEKGKLVRQLKDEIKDLNRRHNVELHASSSNWKEKYDSILVRSRNEGRRHEEEVQDWEERLSSEKQKMRRLEETVAMDEEKYRRKKRQLMNKLANVKEELEDYQADKDRLRKSKEKLAKELDASQDEVLSLRRNLRSITSAKDEEMEEYRSKIKKLKQGSSSLEEKVEEKEGELKALKNERKKLEESVKEVEGFLKDVREEREKIAKKLGETEGKLKKEIEERERVEVDNRKLVDENNDLKERFRWLKFVNEHQLPKGRITLSEEVLHTSELSNVRTGLLDNKIPVAVKTIKPDCGFNNLKTVLREVFNNAAVHDGGKHVAKLFGFYEFKEQGVLFVSLVYEKYDLDLKDFCTDIISPRFKLNFKGSVDRSPTDKKLAEYYKVKILRKMSECLQQIHSKKVQHLDVKPKNFMVRMVPGNRDFDILITDFGFLAVEDLDKSVVLTVEQKCTFEYRGPEFYKEDGQFESHRKSDVWSLGMAFYVVFENDGYPPVRWCRSYQPAINHKSKDRYRIPTFSNRRIQEIAERMMEFERKDRPEIGEVVEFLKKYEKELEGKLKEEEIIDFTVSLEEFKKKMTVKASKRKTVGLLSPSEVRERVKSESVAKKEKVPKNQEIFEEEEGEKEASMEIESSEDSLVIPRAVEANLENSVISVSYITSVVTSPNEEFIKSPSTEDSIMSLENTKERRNRFGFRNLDEDSDDEEDT